MNSNDAFDLYADCFRAIIKTLQGGPVSDEEIATYFNAAIAVTMGAHHLLVKRPVSTSNSANLLLIFMPPLLSLAAQSDFSALGIICRHGKIDQHIPGKHYANGAAYDCCRAIAHRLSLGFQPMFHNRRLQSCRLGDARSCRA